MKILIVHNRYQNGGGEDVVFEQERRLLEKFGHDVVVYQRSNDEIRSQPANLAFIPNTIWSSQAKREFTAILRRAEPDIVHVHNTFVVISPSIYSACREYGVPVVQTLHNFRLYCPAAFFFRKGAVCEECVSDGLWRSVQHGCYRDSRPATAVAALMLAVHRARQTWTREITSYIVPTAFGQAKFIDAGLPADKLFVKPHFVEPDPGMKSDAGDAAVFVGRLSPEKRMSTILEAWSRLEEKVPLIIIGEGAQRERLQAEVNQRDLHSIRFMGQLPRAKALEIIRRARFLLFPSEWYEMFGMVMVEAFACGVPVLCSRLGAMKEIVEDGRTGLHFTAGDAGDLASKVQWAWKHPAELEAMGKNARAEYEAKYTAERNYEMLMKIYQHAILTHAQPASEKLTAIVPVRSDALPPAA